MTVREPNAQLVKFLDDTAIMRDESFVPSLPKERWGDMHATWAQKPLRGVGILLPSMFEGIQNMGVIFNTPRFSDGTMWLQCVRITTPMTMEALTQWGLSDPKPLNEQDIEIWMVRASHARYRAKDLIRLDEIYAEGYITPFRKQPLPTGKDIEALVPTTLCTDHFVPFMMNEADDQEDGFFQGMVIHLGKRVAYPLFTQTETQYVDDSVVQYKHKIDVGPYYLTETMRAFFEKNPHLNFNNEPNCPAGTWSVATPDAVPVSSGVQTRKRKGRGTVSSSRSRSSRRRDM